MTSEVFCVGGFPGGGGGTARGPTIAAHLKPKVQDHCWVFHLWAEDEETGAGLTWRERGSFLSIFDHTEAKVYVKSRVWGCMDAAWNFDDYGSTLWPKSLGIIYFAAAADRT